MQAFDKALRIFCVAGGIAAMAIPVAFPSRGYIAFTIIWTLFVAAFSRRRTLFPDINGYSSDMQDAFTFFGWFAIAVLGAGVASMWLFDGWHFERY